MKTEDLVAIEEQIELNHRLEEAKNAAYASLKRTAQRYIGSEIFSLIDLNGRADLRDVYEKLNNSFVPSINLLKKVIGGAITNLVNNEYIKIESSGKSDRVYIKGRRFPEWKATQELSSHP